MIIINVKPTLSLENENNDIELQERTTIYNKQCIELLVKINCIGILTITILFIIIFNMLTDVFRTNR